MFYVEVVMFYFVGDLYEMAPYEIHSTKCTLQNVTLRNSLYKMPPYEMHSTKVLINQVRSVYFVVVHYEMLTTKC